LYFSASRAPSPEEVVEELLPLAQVHRVADELPQRGYEGGEYPERPAQTEVEVEDLQLALGPASRAHQLLDLLLQRLGQTEVLDDPAVGAARVLTSLAIVLAAMYLSHSSAYVFSTLRSARMRCM